MISKLKVAVQFALLTPLFVVPSLQALPVIDNGGFELTTPPGVAGRMGVDTNATSWTSGGTNYNFIFAPNTADTTGAGASLLQLWGPNNGSPLNGLPGESPALGNFVAADGCFLQNPCINPSTVSQALTNLTPNQSYTVGFWYGFAQQYAFTGQTTQYWEVCLASSCQSTASYVLPSHGFSGWSHQDFTFTAQTATDVLSFSAFGSVPVPPFAVLDGVTVSAVPEPSTLSILALGLLGLLTVGFRRLRAG